AWHRAVVRDLGRPREAGPREHYSSPSAGWMPPYPTRGSQLRRIRVDPSLAAEEVWMSEEAAVRRSVAPGRRPRPLAAAVVMTVAVVVALFNYNRSEANHPES